MLSAYTDIVAEINKSVTALKIKIDNATSKGKAVDFQDKVNVVRLKKVEQVISARIADFGEYAGDTVTSAQKSAIQRGIDAGKELITKALDIAKRDAKGLKPDERLYKIPSKFAEPNMEALNAIIGYTQDGSPVVDVIHRRAGDAADAAITLLRKGIAEGIGTRKLGSMLKKSLYSQQLYPALMLARTETLRAYNTATMENYKANADVLAGWQWDAAINEPGRPPCAACFHLHGKVFEVGSTHEQPPAHPNCRCCAVPVVIVPDEEASVTRSKAEVAGTNQAYNALQGYTTNQKADVLGSQAAAIAYEHEEVTLEDFVTSRYSPNWGTTWGVKSFKQVLDELGSDVAKPIRELVDKTKSEFVKSKPAKSKPKQVDWLTVLPDKWSRCSKSEAVMRINSMLSVDRDYWNKLNEYVDLAKQTGFAKVKKAYDSGVYCVIQPGVSEEQVNHVCEHFLKYIHMLDDNNIPRPMYFDLGYKFERRFGDCLYGVRVHSPCFSDVEDYVTNCSAVKNAQGDVKYLYGNVKYKIGNDYYDAELGNQIPGNAFHISTNTDVPDTALNTLNHEFGHFLTNFFNRPDTIMKGRSYIYKVTEGHKFTPPTYYAATDKLEYLAEMWSIAVDHGASWVPDRDIELFNKFGGLFDAARKAGLISE